MVMCTGHAPSVWLVSTPGRSKERQVPIISDHVFHTLSAVDLSSLVDKGAIRSILLKFDIIIMILFTTHMLCAIAL